MGDIDDEESTVLAGEDGKLGEVGHLRAKRRNGGNGDDQAPLTGLASEAGEATLHPLDRGGGAAVEVGLGEPDCLEHGRVGSAVDDDVVSRGEERAERLADRLGPRGEGDGGGNLEKSGNPVLQRKHGGAAAGARGNEPVGAERAKGGGLHGWMGGKGEVVPKVKVSPRRGCGAGSG